MFKVLKALFTGAAVSASAATAATATSQSDASVRVERVAFDSAGVTLVGDLYLPADLKAGDTAPSAVVTGAWTTVKEQMAGRYARELAERGMVALAFDFRTWGESGGDTRALESPALKIADIKAAAAFLDGRPETGAVTGLGICASAGYMVQAAAESGAFSRVALVAPWLHDAALVDAVYGGPESVASLIATGRAAAAREAETGEPQLIAGTGPEGSDALMPGVPYYSETDRGLIPAWDNAFNLGSWEGWLTYDAIAVAPQLTTPLLVVHSDAAAIPNGARRFLEQVAGPAQSVWLYGVAQFDFYDRDEPVTASADAAAAHLTAS